MRVLTVFQQILALTNSSSVPSFFTAVIQQVSATSTVQVLSSTFSNVLHTACLPISSSLPWPAVRSLSALHCQNMAAPPFMCLLPAGSPRRQDFNELFDPGLLVCVVRQIDVLNCWLIEHVCLPDVPSSVFLSLFGRKKQSQSILVRNTKCCEPQKTIRTSSLVFLWFSMDFYIGQPHQRTGDPQNKLANHKKSWRTTKRAGERQTTRRTIQKRRTTHKNRRNTENNREPVRNQSNKIETTGDRPNIMAKQSNTTANQSNTTANPFASVWLWFALVVFETYRALVGNHIVSTHSEAVAMLCSYQVDNNHTVSKHYETVAMYFLRKWAGITLYP